MASKNRERKAIAAVACPDCGAPRGEMCRRTKEQNFPGRLFVCAGRRLAWQMIRDGEIDEPRCRCGTAFCHHIESYETTDHGDSIYPH